MYVYILWQGQKVMLKTTEFVFIDIKYSKFQYYQHFRFALSECCAENGLPQLKGVDVRGFLK